MDSDPKHLSEERLHVHIGARDVQKRDEQVVENSLVFKVLRMCPYPRNMAIPGDLLVFFQDNASGTAMRQINH
jgi:hypothetical protein